MEVSSGEFIGIIGPNGSGKTSLLRIIYRIYPPSAGAIYIGGSNLLKMSIHDSARYVAVVAQERECEFDFTVREIVSMGRSPHKKLFEGDNKIDDKIVRDSLKRVGLTSLAKRYFHTLSGGEKQRVLIARALAQKAKILLLDEPTNHLDPRYQFEIMELVSSLKITVIVAMHDLNLAAAYCDRLYLLNKGRVIAGGYPRSVLTPRRLKSVYGINAEVEERSPSGRLTVIFNREGHSF